MLRFQAGDKIKVIANGNIGTVVSIDQCYNSVYQEFEDYYNVKWDSFSGPKAYPYLATEGDSEWELLERPDVGSLPFGVNNFKLPSAELDLEDTFKELYPEGCQHSWKLYHGLNESYEYCVTCDKKRINS